jgi:hypothetical protein
VRWRPRTQLIAALIAIVLGYATLPATVRATRFDRRGSDVAAFLETFTRPAERRVLVVHDNAQTLRPYLHQVFGDDRTMDSQAELHQRFSGKELAPPRKIGALERWVTDIIAPEQRFEPLKPEDVDVLVLVGQKMERAGAVVWADPVLDALKQRLTRVSRFRRDERDLEIYERPEPERPATTSR